MPCPEVSVGSTAAPRKMGSKSSVPNCAKQQQHSDHEAHVADAVYPKRLIARIRGRLLQEPEADQQIAAQAHAFPAHEEQCIVRGQNQRQHEKHEEIEIREEAPVAPVVGHIPGGVEMNQPAHAGDDEQHDHGELVDLQREIGAEVSGVDPGEVGLHPGNLRRAERGELPNGFERGQEG